MSYKNPVISIPGVDHGDPAVLKYNGMYYLYHTGPREVPVYCSTNLVDWEHCGVALHASDDPDHWAQIDLWAPEVIYENGTFYMYVTGAVRNGDGTANDRIRRIGVATSNSPTGPFELASEPLTNEWSIDAHPFKDEDGTYYMFYNVRNEYTTGPNGVIGTGNVVDRMVDLQTLSGNPTLVVRPEHHWEGNKEQSFFWNEGPFVLKRNGIYYQMYSAGFFGDDTYGVYYATSSKPMGSNGMKDQSWSKWQGGQAILNTNEFCHGPGHHVVVKGPNGIDDYIVYHGYEPSENVRERRVRVGIFRWDDEHIWLEPPSPNELPMPRLATFDGRFCEKADEINEGLFQHPSEEYLFETNIAFNEQKDLKAQGNAFYLNKENQVKWSIETEQKIFLVQVIKNGKETLRQKYELPKRFNFHAFHLFQIKKEAKDLQLFLDHVLLFKLELDHSEQKGIVRLGKEDASIEFKGTILTKI